MNIFYLDKDIDKCAEYHIDRHVTKMQLELAQILSTNIAVDRSIGYVPRKLDKVERGKLVPVGYKPTHHNHPCTIWARTSLENYEYTFLLAHALNQEAIYRGYKDHKSWQVTLNLPWPENIPSLGFQEPYQAMPDEIKQEDSILAYRKFYKIDKAPFASWKVRDEPYWWNNA